MRLEVYDICPEVLPLFRPRPGDEDAPKYFYAVLKSGLLQHKGWVMFCGAGIPCIALIQYAWNGVGVLTMSFGEGFMNKPDRMSVRITREIEKKLDDAMAGLHRLQVHVRDGYPERRRWVERFGFECEGLQKKFGPDQADYWLYAKTR